MSEDIPKSAKFVAPRRVDSKPSINEMHVLQQLTRDLAKHGNFRIRFVERVEEEIFPTLLVSVSLPRGMQSGDPEVLKLHEIAHQISNVEEIDVLITTSGMTGRGRKLEYETSEIAMNIGTELLDEVPNFFACATLLRSSMRGLSTSKAPVEVHDLCKSLRVFAQICFYLGHESEGLRSLAKHGEVLGNLMKQSGKKIDFSQIFPEYNSAALLYAQFGEFEQALSIVDENFESLRAFIEETEILDRPGQAESMRSLPTDITFARQEMREKILFFKEKHAEIPEICNAVDSYADESIKRFFRGADGS